MRVLSYRVYVGTLQGRESHYDAQSIFELHVRGPFPKLAVARQDRLATSATDCVPQRAP
jgi:hypothetical protein